ncbi:hypothetical protein CFIO01_02946 [Colletotrichum fioriniae PJ7]|uniref:Uncharacterized protein n=1 Tax=Colletotrichum fioriniae PJ7 TaxID=1445577 RepID=A0A010RC99_9PEZI|nr:hypothetical protein CFIO01_02946 [Colletotrichum fioriniae PJ7]
MWAAASGPGFDPTAALTQQFSDLGIHEQAAPPPPQQVAPQQAPAQAPDPAHITEFASERYSVQPAWNGAASAYHYQPYQPPPASFFPAPAPVQQQPSTLGSSRDREVDGGPNGTNYHSLPDAWKPPPSRPEPQALCNVIQGEGHVEGFDAAQEKLLKSKKRRNGVETEEDKWKEIFKILFPSHKDVPDPFYKTPVDDRTAADQTPKQEQDDVESIFTRDIPSPVEEEMTSKLEEAVGGRLTKKKRRKLLNVFRGFAVKMLRQSTEGDIKNRAIILPSKSSQIEKSFGTERSARAPSEKLLRTVAEDKPDEKLEGKQDEVYALHEAMQAGAPSMDSVMALGSLPSIEATGPRSIPVDFQAFGLDMDSDIACWSAWDAAFANDNGDAWLDGLLGTGTALPGGLSQAQDKTFGVEPMNAYDGVSNVSTLQHVVGQDYTS